MGRLTGNESWVKAGVGGATIYAQEWGNSGDDWWWPICGIELDFGLITLDISGMPQNMDLGDMARIRIEEGEIIDSDDFYKVDEVK